MKIGKNILQKYLSSECYATQGKDQRGGGERGFQDCFLVGVHTQINLCCSCFFVCLFVFLRVGEVQSPLLFFQTSSKNSYGRKRGSVTKSRNKHDLKFPVTDNLSVKQKLKHNITYKKKKKKKRKGCMTQIKPPQVSTAYMESSHLS